jgi:hypothetical protein
VKRRESRAYRKLIDGVSGVALRRPCDGLLIVRLLAVVENELRHDRSSSARLTGDCNVVGVATEFLLEGSWEAVSMRRAEKGNGGGLGGGRKGTNSDVGLDPVDGETTVEKTDVGGFTLPQRSLAVVVPESARAEAARS